MDNKVINDIAEILQEIRNPQTITEEEKDPRVTKKALGLDEAVVDSTFDSYRAEIFDNIEKLWRTKFKNSRVWGAPKRNDFAPRHMTLNFTLGYDKDEFKNSIVNNDPLNLSMTISLNPDDTITVEYRNASIMVNPKSRHMAFDSEKFKLRGASIKGTKGTPTSKLYAKLKKDFAKVYDIVKKALADGRLDVHDKMPLPNGQNVTDMVKDKLR